MEQFRHFWGEEKGAVVILAAAGMAVFLGLAALVIDVGLLFLTRQQLVNSADAAVLAGAQELPHDSVQAIAEAEKYFAYNDAGENYQLKVRENDTQLEAIVTKEVKFFFGRILGLASSEVGAVSKAAVGTLTGHKGVAPLGIPEQHLVFGQQYRLKAGGGSGETGYYGALALGLSGAETYKKNIMYGFSQMLRINDIVDTETGNMSGPTGQSVNWRIDQCDHGALCSPDSFQLDCPRILIIPVYEPYNWEQNQLKQVRIVGFAAFYVEKVDGQGNESEVVGRFVQKVEPGEMEIGLGGASKYGVFSVKLIK